MSSRRAKRMRHLDERSGEICKRSVTRKKNAIANPPHRASHLTDSRAPTSAHATHRRPTMKTTLAFATCSLSSLAVAAPLPPRNSRPARGETTRCRRADKVPVLNWNFGRSARSNSSSSRRTTAVSAASRQLRQHAGSTMSGGLLVREQETVPARSSSRRRPLRRR